MDKKFIDIITKNSFQVIKSAGVTKRNEFVDINDTKIPEGIPYHIHRTRDKQEFYMTSAQHETNSILIFKEKGGITDFYRYKSLIDKKSEIYLQETPTIPTETDYERGFINLYFARQANDINSKIFEITSDDYVRKTPFYEKKNLTLKITGTIDNVISYNESIIETTDAYFPGISLVISSLSYYQESRFSTSSPSSTSGGSSGGSSGGGY
jgi:hypothetical protein